MSLKLCLQCHQHHIGNSCPHCETKTSPKLSTAMLLGLSMTAMSCLEKETQALYGAPVYDLDEDGFFEPDDCDETDANTYPGAAAQDSESACMQDSDGDGYGNANPENENVEAGTDCDDSDPDINPGAGNCE